MLRVGIVGWRGMVGSVLMERMQAEGDFAEIEESDLDDYLEGLKVVPRKRSR